MDTPRTTGQVARLLDVIEPQLNEAVRRGRVRPAPTVVAGRRQWELDHIRQAAEHFKVQSAQLDALLGEADRG